MKPFMLVLCCAVLGFGQEPMDDIIESLTDGTEEEEYIRETTERLEELRRTPVNVTRPAYGELLRIPFISPLLAESIILFADTVEVDDIRLLRGAAMMTPELFERIAPFITAETPRRFTAYIVPHRLELRSRVERRVQKTHGVQDGKYEGDPFSEYQRVELEGESVSAAFLREKDAGESSGNAFSAGYVMVNGLPGVDRIIVGNFSVPSSQGLILSRSMSASKGSDAAGQAMRRSSGISPSVSADEFRYFSGTALRSTFGLFTLTGFTSFRKLPASVDSSGAVTSFYTSGLFRNASERERQENVTERTNGIVTEYRSTPSTLFTVNAVRILYGRDIITSSLFARAHRPIEAGSIGWDIPLFGLRVFGETASNDLRQFSTAAGLLIPVKRTFSLLYHHRSLPNGFRTPFGRPFAERGLGRGEYGNYIGIEFPAERFRLAGFIDQYRFPATGEEFASSGTDALVSAEFPAAKGHIVQLQYRYSRKNEQIVSGTSRFRIGHMMTITKRITLVQRMEQVRVSGGQEEGTESGVLAYSELRYRSVNEVLSFRTRVVWFDAPSYASRLYQYEADVPGNVSNPPLYGSGFRWYALVRYTVADGCWLSAKYGETMKLHETSLGSGDDAIDGAVDGRFAVQLDFRL